MLKNIPSWDAKKKLVWLVSEAEAEVTNLQFALKGTLRRALCSLLALRGAVDHSDLVCAKDDNFATALV
jgi:hypothetical protein